MAVEHIHHCTSTWKLRALDMINISSMKIHISTGAAHSGAQAMLSPSEIRSTTVSANVRSHGGFGHDVKPRETASLDVFKSTF